MQPYCVFLLVKGQRNMGPHIEKVMISPLSYVYQEKVNLGEALMQTRTSVRRVAEANLVWHNSLLLSI